MLLRTGMIRLEDAELVSYKLGNDDEMECRVCLTNLGGVDAVRTSTYRWPVLS